MTEYHPWEIWNGGECPCPGERVQVQLEWETRYRAEEREPGIADPWHWTAGCGIIAFRRVKKPEAVTKHAHLDGGLWLFGSRQSEKDTHRLIFEVVNGEPVNPRFERIE